MRKEDERKLVYVETDKLIPYANNAKIHGDIDVDAVMASIKRFGFTNPILTWKGIVAAGHGRLLAAKRLGLEKVPTIPLDYMSDEERRAYILADNRIAELSGWDFNVQSAELAEISEIDMSEFGFNDDAVGDWFQDRERNDKSRQDGNDEYNDFLEKFEVKKTTDDCYTPDNIYEAVANWVAEEYGVSRSEMKRPFYPGGDYQRFKYEGGSW